MNRRKSDVSIVAQAVAFAVVTCLLLLYCGY